MNSSFPQKTKKAYASPTNNDPGLHRRKPTYYLVPVSIARKQCWFVSTGEREACSHNHVVSTGVKHPLSRLLSLHQRCFLLARSILEKPLCCTKAFYKQERGRDETISKYSFLDIPAPERNCLANEERTIAPLSPMVSNDYWVLRGVSLRAYGTCAALYEQALGLGSPRHLGPYHVHPCL
jgi:hypothetical protein